MKEFLSKLLVVRNSKVQQEWWWWGLNVKINTYLRLKQTVSYNHLMFISRNWNFNYKINNLKDLFIILICSIVSILFKLIPEIRILKSVVLFDLSVFISTLNKKNSC